MKPSIGATLIKLIALVSNDIILKSDAIVCLEGDGFTRSKKSAKLFKEGWGRVVVVSGGYENKPFSFPSKDLAKDLIKRGIPKKKIILETKSQNTYEQGIEVMKLVKQKKWKKIVLVVSHFHQLRAYLTFLKVMKDLNLKIQIFNAPVRELSWFDKTSLGLNRFQLLELELEKINQYIKKGHLVAIVEALEYQKWKEKQK